MKKLLAVFCLGLIAPLIACAQSEAPAFVEGKHYFALAVPLSTPQDKIEVLEFFWYGCGHCYSFEPMLQQWKKRLPEDVVLTPSPAVWRPPMDLHAQAYYAALALGVVDTVHPAIFEAMNPQRKRLGSKQEIGQVFVASGVSADDFNKAFDSFGVSSQVRQAAARARGAQIEGTPEIVVAGKYRVSAMAAGSQANMLKVADFLIEKERTLRAQ